MVFSLISNTNPSNETKILLGIYMAVATFIWFTLIVFLFQKFQRVNLLRKNLPYLEKNYRCYINLDSITNSLLRLFMNTPLGLTEIISKLEKQEGKGLPPVHLWNPPLCENVEMKINSKGDWFFNNSPINRKKMVQLFSTVLRRDEEDYFLVTPVEKIKVVVEKKPFVIIDFEIKEEEKADNLFSN